MKRLETVTVGLSLLPADASLLKYVALLAGYGVGRRFRFAGTQVRPDRHEHARPQHRGLVPVRERDLFGARRIAGSRAGRQAPRRLSEPVPTPHHRARHLVQARPENELNFEPPRGSAQAGRGVRATLPPGLSASGRRLRLPPTVERQPEREALADEPTAGVFALPGDRCQRVGGRRVGYGRVNASPECEGVLNPRGVVNESGASATGRAFGRPDTCEAMCCHIAQCRPAFHSEHP